MAAGASFAAMPPPPRTICAVPLPRFAREELERHPPPIPSITVPLPPHSGQVPPSASPEPAQRGQAFSPVPGVPGAASSPG